MPSKRETKSALRGITTKREPISNGEEPISHLHQEELRRWNVDLGRATARARRDRVRNHPQPNSPDAKVRRRRRLGRGLALNRVTSVSRKKRFVKIYKRELERVLPSYWSEETGRVEVSEELLRRLEGSARLEAYRQTKWMPEGISLDDGTEEKNPFR